MNLRILGGERKAADGQGWGSSPGDTALRGCEEDAIIGAIQRVKRLCQTRSVTAEHKILLVKGLRAQRQKRKQTQVQTANRTLQSSTKHGVVGVSGVQSQTRPGFSAALSRFST